MDRQAQLSDSTVFTILQESPHLFSLHMQGEGQCGDVWWGMVDKAYY